MVEKSQDKEMDKSVAVGNVENNSEKDFFLLFPKIFNLFDIFMKERLYKVGKLRNKNCIKDAKS